ncbi:hypothetical protein [Aliterella atlantica]
MKTLIWRSRSIKLSSDRPCREQSVCVRFEAFYLTNFLIASAYYF